MSDRHSGIMDHSRVSADEEAIKKTITHVKVLHNFRGSNNDELCMKKDDVSINFLPRSFS